MFRNQNYYKKTSILILGANGYIGKAIYRILSKNDIWFTVTGHSRRDCHHFKTCEYNSSEFIKLINEYEIIIICAGIGLSKLYKTHESNFSIIENVLERIHNAPSQPKLIYLSTMKAYNPQKYNDIYGIKITF